MQKYLDDGNTVPSADTDWVKETTRTGVIQNYNVSVSNGNEKGSSYLSLGYYKNLGIIKYSDFERLSARINTDYKLIGNVLTIGEHFTLNRTSENTPTSPVAMPTVKTLSVAWSATRTTATPTGVPLVMYI